VSRQEITEKIIFNISNNFGLYESEVCAESSFESVEANSIDVIEIIVDIEDEFKIQIPDSKLLVFQSVKLLVDYVDTSLNRKHKIKHIKN
jgi:acyl carrier protein